MEPFQANIEQRRRDGYPEMTLETQLQRPDSDAGSLGQALQVERLRRVRLEALPRPFEYSRQWTAMS